MPDFGRGTSALRPTPSAVGLQRIFSQCRIRASAPNDTRRQFGCGPTVVDNRRAAQPAGVDYGLHPRSTPERCQRAKATPQHRGPSHEVRMPSFYPDLSRTARIPPPYEWRMGFHFASLIVHTADYVPRLCEAKPPVTGGPETACRNRSTRR